MLDCNFWPCMCWRRTSWMQSNISCSLIWARKNRFGQQLNWDGPHCPGKVRLISFPLSPSYSCYIKCIHAEPSRAEPPVTSFLVTWSFLHLFSFFFFLISDYVLVIVFVFWRKNTLNTITTVFHVIFSHFSLILVKWCLILDDTVFLFDKKLQN